MDILEAIRERRSVRNFDGNSLSENNRKILMDLVEHSTSPFGGNVTIRLKRFDMKEGYKPRTYGMIKGATDFFMLGIGDDEASSLTAGFRFEQVVLKAWQLGLGTCWIAATFKGSTFEDENIWPDGEKLRVICPVGTPAKQSLMEKVTRLSLGSKKRRPFAELFYDWDFEHSLSPKNRFDLALEMMRLAPSSTNSQPWRAVVADDTVHFYYKPQSKSSVLDCGIGICHFYEAEEYQSHNGEFFKATCPPVSHESWKYLYSYKSNS